MNVSEDRHTLIFEDIKVFPKKLLHESDGEPYEEVTDVAGDELVDVLDEGGVLLDGHRHDGTHDGEDSSGQGDGGSLRQQRWVKYHAPRVIIELGCLIPDLMLPVVFFLDIEQLSY